MDYKKKRYSERRRKLFVWKSEFILHEIIRRNDTLKGDGNFSFVFIYLSNILYKKKRYSERRRKRLTNFIINILYFK